MIGKTPTTPVFMDLKPYKPVRKSLQQDLILQLHCKGPTGKVSRMKVDLTASMGVPGKNG
jgi:hypothetical protein